tara:strand:- start:2132 stop:2638 length:507 start_codon:yes stop_codon:yes gene_type:complete
MRKPTKELVDSSIPKDPIVLSTDHVPVISDSSFGSSSMVVEVGAIVVGTSVVEVAVRVVDGTVTALVVVVAAWAADAICIADSRSGGGGASSRRRNHHPAKTAIPIRAKVIKTSFLFMFISIYLSLHTRRIKAMITPVLAIRMRVSKNLDFRILKLINQFLFIAISSR